MKSLQPINLPKNEDILPLIEGGKGVSASNGYSAGAWANCGGIGTFSAVNADSFDKEGNPIPYEYFGKTRKLRHKELIELSIKGAIEQAKIAYEESRGNGLINMNVLWEMGGVEEILHGSLKEISHLIHGVTCGAGMPFKLSEICASYGLSYYPIVSSARAFMILWKRAYRKYPENLGGVVYEDPWLAGGHNGVTNDEDPFVPEPPMPRVIKIRNLMNSFGLEHVPIIMAGGVWNLSEWEDWIDNKEVGKIAFQFGTRPLLTKESPIPEIWKKKLTTLKEGQIKNNLFSPTGFYSSAVENTFLNKLQERSARQVSFSKSIIDDFTEELKVGVRNRSIYLKKEDKIFAKKWIEEGYTQAMKTPDSTVVFVTEEDEKTITNDQINCMGCLSACKFSNWSHNEAGTTGKKTDPRSFCIQKSLQDIAHGANPENELMFSGHNGYRFAIDPMYKNGHVPTVKELIDAIKIGR